MDIGKPERDTQRRVIALFRVELGYRFLGNWAGRLGNSNIEESLLTAYLRDTANYSAGQISRAIYLLRTEADKHNRSLYDNTGAARGVGILKGRFPQTAGFA